MSILVHENNPNGNMPLPFFKMGHLKLCRKTSLQILCIIYTALKQMMKKTRH